MKYFRLINILLMLTVSALALAQDEYIITNITEQRCVSDVPYYWYEHVITKKGTYEHIDQEPQPGIPGKKTVLKITFTEHVTINKYFEIREGGSITFRGKVYNQEGTYTDKKPSATTCDTTYTIIIALSEDYHFYETVNICKPDIPYFWRNKNCYYTGEYKDSYRTKDNKHDSIYHLTLNVYTPREYTTYETICADELPYQFGTLSIQEPGYYTDTIHRDYGCTDTVHLWLSVVQRSVYRRQVTFCKNEGFKRDTTTYYEEMTFHDTIPTHTGCDSVVETKYIPLPSYRFETKVGRKAGESYTWAHTGETYTNDTNVYKYYKTVDGNCDSIHILYLTTTEEARAHYNACEGDTLYYKKYKIYKDTTLIDTLLSCRGGDSLVFVSYTFHHSFYDTINVSICEGDSIILTEERTSPIKPDSVIIDTTIIKTAGSYFNQKRTRAGCDSISLLRVSVIPRFEHDTIVVVPNDSLPYSWKDMHGKTHSWHIKNVDTMIIDNTLGRTEDGCDSIWKMRLITKEIAGYQKVPLCKGSVVIINKQKYREPGKYLQSFTSSSKIQAKDSFCCYDVYWIETYDNPDVYDTARICKSETPYKWHSKFLNSSINCSDTLTSSLGCDSVAYLHLEVLPSPDTTLYDTICRGDSIKIAGKYIKGAGTYPDTLLSQYGCDSIVKHIVNVFDPFFKEEVGHFPQGSTYYWHKDNQPIELTKPGIYFDSCISQYGCDSIYRLTLTEDKSYYHLEYDTICANELSTYRWHNQRFYSDTIAFDSLHTSMGLDSVFELRLHVFPQYKVHQNYTMCKGETFAPLEKKILKSGTYVDSCVSTHGCDSINYYHINILPSDSINEEIYLGAQQFYQWHGQEITKPGWYEDRVLTSEGCYSIYRLHAIEDPLSPGEHKRVKICEIDTPYEWHGQKYSTSGEYIFQYEPQPGLVSTNYLSLTIGKSYLMESTIDLCTGGSYSFFGRELTEPGVYEEVMTSTQGCDSIYRVTINRLPSSYNDVNIFICQGETIGIADTLISSACKFSRTYPSITGCDSVVRYLVTVSAATFHPTQATLCEGETYTWKRANRPDTILTRSGIYYDTYQSTRGCDSAIYELSLTTHRISIWDTVIYVCPDETYIFKGKEYNITQVLSDTIPNQFGCDSIRNYHYKMMTFCTVVDNYLHCYGESLIIDGRNYSEDGDYRVPLNKDTLHRFTIASHPTYEYSKDIGSFCDSVIYEGTTYYARGEKFTTFTIDRHMQTVKYGCDSIEHVTMSIFKSAKTPTFHQTIDDYAYVIFDNEYYSTTGVYSHPYHTIHGCDSTIVLDLTVNPTEHPGSLLYEYCALSVSEPLNIFGKKYRPTADTTILDTIIIPKSPLMIVRKAEVAVEEAFKILNLEPEQVICAEKQLEFNIYFTNTGITPRQYEFKFLPNDISATPAEQSDKVDPLNKSILIKMDGQGVCIRPGIYPYSIRLKGERCHLSDTTLYGDITVRYPASIMEANWSDFVALQNENRNPGGWVLQAPYQWKVISRLGDDKTALVAPQDASQPYLYSEYLENGDKITAYLLREGYSHIIPSCEYTFESVPTEGRKPVLISPTIAKKSSQIILNASSNGKYRLLDNSGHVCQAGEYQEGEQQIQAPATAGCYIIQIIGNNDATKTQKIIIY